jgi:hypothetical protein
VNAQLSAYPWPWSLVAYIVLGIGWVAVVWFLARYMIKADWFATEIGRHLVAFSGCVGGFFTLYLMLAIWPDFPGRGAIRIALLFALVSVCVWRAWLLEKTFRGDRRKGT